MEHILNPTLRNKVVAILVAAALALGMSITLGGCAGQSDEDVIRDGVTEMLDAFKDPSAENLSQYIGDIDVDQAKELEAYGLDVYEFFGHAFRNYDYELGDINVTGNKALVNVTITNTDVAKVASEVIDKAQNDETISAEVKKIAETGDQAEVMKYIFTLIYEELDATDETMSSTITLSLDKDGNNEWHIDEESLTVLMNALYGGFSV